MRCPLCRLGYPQPHTTLDWQRAVNELHDWWREPCKRHNLPQMTCATCKASTYRHEDTIELTGAAADRAEEIIAERESRNQQD